jgi:nicotinamidase-related amidase
MKPAIIVVDMLNDFVHGALKCERAQQIIDPLRRLLDGARRAGIPVVFSNDAHVPEVDHEFSIWGPHALAGTPEAQVIPELAPQPGDYQVPKRRYSGFYGTDLEMLLQELGVDTVILTGLHTNICVRHTAADAFYRGYHIIVPTDGVQAFTEDDHQSGLDYLKRVYGAELLSGAEVLERLPARTPAAPAA